MSSNKTNRRGLALLSLIMYMFFLSCGTVRWRDFRPLEREQPITLFDRYSMDVRGYATGNLFISFAYLNEIQDTTRLDTLPIIKIDRICFRGNCLIKPFCRKPLSWAETRDYRQLGVVYYGKSVSNKPFKYYDLFYIEGKVVPGGFELSGAYELPPDCKDSAISVEFRTWLLNRATSRVIAKELREIRFLITPKMKFTMGS